MHTAMNKNDFIQIFEEKKNQHKQDHLFQSRNINISIVYFFRCRSDLPHIKLMCLSIGRTVALSVIS